MHTLFCHKNWKLKLPISHTIRQLNHQRKYDLDTSTNITAYKQRQKVASIAFILSRTQVVLTVGVIGIMSNKSNAKKQNVK